VCCAVLPAGVALTLYFSMGLFGAALYGQQTGERVAGGGACLFCCAGSSRSAHSLVESCSSAHAVLARSSAWLLGKELLLLLLLLLPTFPAEGNIMLNDLVESTVGTAILYSSMLVYLALGMTTTQYALRQSLDAIFVGEGAGFTWRRHVSGCAALPSTSCACCVRSFQLPSNRRCCCAGPSTALALADCLSLSVFAHACRSS
jgi:hypothetical protein